MFGEPKGDETMTQRAEIIASLTARILALHHADELDREETQAVWIEAARAGVGVDVWEAYQTAILFPSEY